MSAFVPVRACVHVCVCASLGVLCCAVLRCHPKTFAVSSGTGFIGRHLVTHIVENKLAALVRVVDKVSMRAPPAPLQNNAESTCW